MEIDCGTDVSINYDGSAPSGSVRLTIYAYKGGKPNFLRQFDDEKDAIRRHKANVVLRREAAVRVAGRSGRMALFTYRARAGEVATRLYLFPIRAGGLIKFRVTHLAADNAVVDATMKRLLALVGWPG